MCVYLCVICVHWTTERQTLLFIGHAFVGYDGATCRLHGSCAVTDVYLNNTKLQQLSQVCCVSLLSSQAIHSTIHVLFFLYHGFCEQNMICHLLSYLTAHYSVYTCVSFNIRLFKLTFHCNINHTC